jgi:septum formation protein
MLVLASASPRRQALVRLLNLPWRSTPAEVDEAAHLLPDPFVGALNVAVAKARTVRLDDRDEVVLAADTLVVAHGVVLGKPADASEARQMLQALRGKAHQVLTGVALRRADEAAWGAVVSTRVMMRTYADDDVEAYIARGEPFDKAGGYAVQDAEFHPVEHLDGCYLNVVGLPLCAVAAGLAALGAELGGTSRPPCSFCRAGAALVSVRPAF